jgi:hypothetical protein
MQRNTIGFALIALFTIAVIGIAASSIHSTPIQSGFGIEVNGNEPTVKNESNSRNRSVPSSGGGGGEGGGLGGIEFDVENSSSTGSGSVSPVVVLVALIGVAAVGAALVVWATRDDATPRAGSIPATTETNDVDASRPEPSEPVELTNEVYRAWWEMARQVDISPTASRSPSEFAAAAVDAGMNPDAVAELTHLFRAARYGGTLVTDDDEQQATAALDRIYSQSNDSDQETNS